eukprot:g5525.t1
MYMWGNAEHGRLGLGGASGGETTPVHCKAIDHIKSVDCGGAHTVALTDNGEVWSFGLNSRGQLGHSPDKDHVQLPEKVSIPEPINCISAGNWHTLCLSESGNIWSFGCNAFGQLGLGKQAEKRLFLNLDECVFFYKGNLELMSFLGIEICCGASHSLAISDTGELFSWGTNQHGQLGHERGFFTSSIEYSPRFIRSLRDIKITSLGAGQVCSGALDDSGNIYTWGSNQFWQLGHSTTGGEFSIPQQLPSLTNARSLIIGGFHTMCITQNLSVYVWGTNENGCLGIGQSGQDYTPVEHLDMSFDQTRGPSVRTQLASGASQGIPMIVQSPMLLPSLRLVQGSLGWKHSAGVGLRGEVYSWGWGGAVGEASALLEENQGPGGQLGIGDDYDSWSPLPIKMNTSSSSQQLVKFCQVDCGLNHTAAIGEQVQD